MEPKDAADLLEVTTETLTLWIKNHKIRRFWAPKSKRRVHRKYFTTDILNLATIQQIERWENRNIEQLDKEWKERNNG